MAEKIELSPGTTLTVRGRSEAELLLEAVYPPGSAPPPKHHHPDQDEHFEVLAGSIRVRVDEEERDLAAGEEIDIARRSVHQMWNPGSEPATVLWRTTPAGRTEEWFRALSALLGRAAAGGDDAPGPDAFADLLAEYRDTIRIET